MTGRLRRLRDRGRLLVGTGAALARHHLLGRPVPLSVTLAPTNRCTGRCAYCGIWELRQEGERPPAFWVDLLRALHAHGTRRVGFTGGEALLYGGVDRVVAEARRLGMLTSLGTNGLLVPERAAVVRALDFLVVSLDGPRAVNDAQRFAGSHAAALRAIEVARSVGTRVWLTTVVTRASADALADHLAFAAAHDLRVNLQLPFHPVGYCGRDNDERFPTDEQLARVLALARANAGPGGRVLNTLAYWDHVERWLHLGATTLPTDAAPGPAEERALRCVGGGLFFHVEPDGRVYACTQLADQVPALAPGPDVPLAAALRRAGEAACVTCLSSYAQEQTLLFHLTPRAVAAWVREVLGASRGA